MKEASHISRFSAFIAAMAVLSLFWATCAKPISPTGGPRDEVAPKVSKTVPENQSLNFEGKEIKILFDE